MARALVVVESVAKATRIQGMLGPDYIVRPSIGHIRDLPQSAAEIPASVKGEKWARLGINVHDHFKPVYVVSSDRKKIVAELKAALKEVDELYLATDEDREGEAIAWHLQEVLNRKVPVKRMVFHEITPAAIAARGRARPATSTCDWSTPRRAGGSSTAWSATRSRPVLWRAVDKARSAGRVQSVAIRLVCERERERMAFTSATWFDVTATLDATGTSFEATARHPWTAVVAGHRQELRRVGVLDAEGADVEVLSAARRRRSAAALAGRRAPGSTSVASTPRTQRPQPPFMTSSLQIEASRKLRFDPERTMRAAQRLYEQGWITYMRTDSTTLVGRGDRRGARDRGRDVRRRLRRRRAAPLRPQGQERPGGPRGDPPGGRVVPLARGGRSPCSAATSAPSTTSCGSAPSPARWSTPGSPRTGCAWRRRSRASPGSTGGDRGRARARRACASSSRAFDAPTSRAPTTPRPSWPTRSGSCPPLSEGEVGAGDATPRPRATRPSRRTATPRRR